MKNDGKNEQRSRFQRIKFYGIYLSKYKTPPKKKICRPVFNLETSAKNYKNSQSLKGPC